MRLSTHISEAYEAFKKCCFSFIVHVIQLLPSNTTSPIAGSLHYEVWTVMSPWPPTSLISLWGSLSIFSLKLWIPTADRVMLLCKINQLTITAHSWGRQPHYFWVHFTDLSFYSVTEKSFGGERTGNTFSSFFRLNTGWVAWINCSLKQGLCFYALNFSKHWCTYMLC